MVEIFHGANRHDDYLHWLEAHPNGFVLQLNQSSDCKLHRA